MAVFQEVLYRELGTIFLIVGFLLYLSNRARGGKNKGRVWAWSITFLFAGIVALALSVLIPIFISLL